MSKKVYSREDIPPPFISTGTLEKQKRDLSSDKVARAVSKEVAKVLGQSPKEVYSDIMDIPPKTYKILWRPNNYRRQMPIKEVLDIPLNLLGGVYRDFKVSKKNLVFVRDYAGVLLILGRRQLQGVWCQPHRGSKKEVTVIERSSPVDLDKAIDEKKELIRRTVDDAMVDFARKLKIFLPFVQPVWSRSENWVKSVDLLPSWPVDLVMYDTIFKKVYADDALEFVSGRGDDPSSSMKFYVKNHALKDLAPDIAASLDSLAFEIASLRPQKSVLCTIQSLVKVFPDDFFKEDVCKMVNNLNVDDLELLSEWTFDNFGGDMNG